MDRPQFVENQIYHLYNRGVEKRRIFLNQKDYVRFIIDLYEFNDIAPALNFGRSIFAQPIEVRLQSKRQQPQVALLAFCLMPNHYHIMVQQLTKNGITNFMRKLGTGYTNYFNTKYERVGSLFQGKFKATLLTHEAHFLYLPHYIHLNSLDVAPLRIKNTSASKKETIDFLQKYRWSSLPDYLGTKNFPTVIDKKFLTACIGDKNEFRSQTQEWLTSGDIQSIQDVMFDDLID